MQRIDVRDFGAAGDGVADDFAAIRRAVSALEAGAELYFPAGTYRAATRGTVVHVIGLSDLAVRFAPDARLLMDNLDAQGRGSGHAFSFRGPARGLILEGLRIEWKTKPNKRSHGDGIRIDGPAGFQGPSAQRTLKDISITNCHIKKAPQTGMVLMGCSNIVIDDIELADTHADGIHLNACQHYRVSNVTGLRLGDDNVALVTYYRPATDNFCLSGRKGGPYTQPALGEWSNYHGVVKNVRTSEKTRANGLRIAGALDVKVEQIQATKKKAAIIVDAGRKGNTFGWEYQASRQITVRGVDARECHVGVHIMTFNVLPVDALFWDFEVLLDNIILEGCSHDNLLVEKCSGITLGGVRSSHGRIRLINLNNLTVDALHQQQGAVGIHGLSALTSGASPSDSHLQLRRVVVIQGSIQLENASAVEAQELIVYSDADNSGITLVNIRQATIGSLVSVMARQVGVRIVNCQQLTVGNARIDGTGRKFVPLEVGGGTATSVTQDIDFKQIIYHNPKGTSRPRFQQGPHAPRQVSIRLEHRRQLHQTTAPLHYQLP